MSYTILRNVQNILSFPGGGNVNLQGVVIGLRLELNFLES